MNESAFTTVAADRVPATGGETAVRDRRIVWKQEQMLPRRGFTRQAAV